MATFDNDHEHNRGGGGGGGASLHPLIKGLIESLPSPGSEWSDDEMVIWLQVLASNFRIIYKGIGPVSVQSALKP